jgi:putative transposase
VGYVPGDGRRLTAALMLSEVRMLKDIEEENPQLRKLVAHLTPNKEMLSEALRKLKKLK